MPAPHLRPSSPRPRPLTELAAAAGAGEVSADWAAVQVTGITQDSRQVRSGDLYAALPGEHVHGAAFAADAAAAGAVAVLTDRLGRERGRQGGLPLVTVPDVRAVLGAVAAEIYGRPAESMLMLGVTGTNGKTTLAHLMEAGLRAGGYTTGVLGTAGTRIADEAVPSVRTTPEAPELHALLAVMLERDVAAVAMEVSSHALEMNRVGGVRYDVAVFTNLSHDHLDFHFSLESYFRAKAELFTAGRAAGAVINLDDEHGRRLVTLAAEAGVPVATYSAAGDPAADWHASAVDTTPRGSRFVVAGPGGRRSEVSVSLPGRFNVENTLGAIAALVTAGMDLQVAVTGVGTCTGVPGRMEIVDAGQPFLAVVDYAHTPEAVDTLLRSLRAVSDGRLAIVLGAGGDRDTAKRPLMGEAAARSADLVVLTDDNPRSEDPAAILAAVREGTRRVGAANSGEILVEHDRDTAIRAAVSRARAGDVVVVAGKGHEQGQEVGGTTRPFDDRDALRTAIREVAQ